MPGKARGAARLMIKGRLQPALEEAPDTILKDRLWAQPARITESVEPAQPRANVPDLIAIDVVKDRRTLGIADPLEPGRHFRGYVEPARFQHERHDGEPRKQVIGSRGRSFPQAVMGGQIAVAGAKLGQPGRQ
jgi:hypothetical protein